MIRLKEPATPSSIGNPTPAPRPRSPNTASRTLLKLRPFLTRSFIQRHRPRRVHELVHPAWPRLPVAHAGFGGCGTAHQIDDHPNGTTGWEQLRRGWRV